MLRLFRKVESEDEKRRRNEEALRMMEESERVIAANPGLFPRSNTVIGEIVEFTEWQKRQKPRALADSISREGEE